MGNSFNVLVWDGFGCGLNLIQPRLFDLYNKKSCITFNSFNSFNYQTDKDIEEFLVEHKIKELYGRYYKVIK